MKPIFYGIVKHGKITWDSPAQRDKHIQSLDGIGIIETIKRRFKPRSLNQNSLYWEWMTILGASIGYNKETMHFVFKKLYLANKMPILSKDEFMVFLQNESKQIESTQPLTTKEMKEYMDKVNLQAQEINIELPIPDPDPLK